MIFILLISILIHLFRLLHSCYQYQQSNIFISCQLSHYYLSIYYHPQSLPHHPFPHIIPHLLTIFPQICIIFKQRKSTNKEGLIFLFPLLNLQKLNYLKLMSCIYDIMGRKKGKENQNNFNLFGKTINCSLFFLAVLDFVLFWNLLLETLVTLVSICFIFSIFDHPIILTPNKFKKMLDQTSAKQLGLSGSFPFCHLTNVSFTKSNPIWYKSKGVNSPIQFPLPHYYEFNKIGKTLGLDTTRYIEYNKGILYYFENGNDQQYKGYCNIQNLYMYIFVAGGQYAFYLTNGVDSSIFYFPNSSFIQNVSSQLLKQVVQLNFRERYKITDEIGEGTFSKVYLVVNRLNNKKYAAKIVPKIDSTGFYTKGIVQQQKRILKFLNNPLIGQMHEFYQENDNFIFILEYIQGLDLNKYIKQMIETPLNQNILILKQILQSLEYIHKLNIIHRDLKPHNIVYNKKDKSIKLIDFGLSLIYDQNTQLKKFMRCGTMGYIAPEIVNNTETNRKRYDTQSDMFGFGIIAHMLLMGSNPIRGKSYKETVQKNMKGEANLDKKSILVRHGSLCYEFLDKLLQKDPSKRMTASQALSHKFLQQKRKDEQTVLNEQTQNQMLKDHKNDQINYIQDKQFMMTGSKVVNLNITMSKMNLSMDSSINNNKSNPKMQSIHNLDTQNSPTKKSGASWISTTYMATNHMSNSRSNGKQ